MAGMSIDGLISGMDTGTLVTQLIQAEARTADRAQEPAAAPPDASAAPTARSTPGSTPSAPPPRRSPSPTPGRRPRRRSSSRQGERQRGQRRPPTGASPSPSPRWPPPTRLRRATTRWAGDWPTPASITSHRHQRSAEPPPRRSPARRHRSRWPRRRRRSTTARLGLTRRRRADRPRASTPSQLTSDDVRRDGDVTRHDRPGTGAGFATTGAGRRRQLTVGTTVDALDDHLGHQHVHRPHAGPERHRQQGRRDPASRVGVTADPDAVAAKVQALVDAVNARWASVKTYTNASGSTGRRAQGRLRA